MHLLNVNTAGALKRTRPKQELPHYGSQPNNHRNAMYCYDIARYTKKREDIEGSVKDLAATAIKQTQLVSCLRPISRLHIWSVAEADVFLLLLGIGYTTVKAGCLRLAASGY